METYKYLGIIKDDTTKQVEMKEKVKKADHWPIEYMFDNGPGDWGSMPGRVIPKTKKNGTRCRLP